MQDHTSRIVEVRGDWLAYDPETDERISRISLFKELVQGLAFDPMSTPRVEIVAQLIEPDNSRSNPPTRTDHTRPAPRTLRSRPDFEQDFLQPEHTPRSNIAVTCARCRVAETFAAHNDEDAIEIARRHGWMITVRGTPDHDYSYCLCPEDYRQRRQEDLAIKGVEHG